MPSNLKFDDPDRLRVAIAGRSNSGKTTLVRTLLRSPVGDIADRANVTTVVDYYADDELGVILVDTPGFQDAGTYRAYRMARNVSPAIAESIRDGQDFSLEDRAVDGVAACDLAIYVASLETVPDLSHGQELRLLRDEGPVVALLNKRRLAVRAYGEAGAEARQLQWIRVFADAGIAWAEYDAHVSAPMQLRAVHALILAHLSPAQAERMRDYMRSSDQRAATQRDKVAADFARRVPAFRGFVVTASIPRAEYSPQNGERVGLEALRAAVGERLSGFVVQCAEVYGFRPHFAEEALSLDPEVKQSFFEGGVGSGIFGAMWGANAGGTLGGGALGVVGAVAGFLVGGPAGAWAGFELGGMWGIGLGAAAGGAGAARAMFMGDDEAKVEIRIDQPVLAAYAELATAWAAALAYRGFGKGEDVGVESMRELRDEVRQVLAAAPIDLMSAGEDEVRRWMRERLEALRI